jgi:hypothetical protein
MARREPLDVDVSSCEQTRDNADKETTVTIPSVLDHPFFCFCPYLSLIPSTQHLARRSELVMRRPLVCACRLAGFQDLGNFNHTREVEGRERGREGGKLPHDHFISFYRKLDKPKLKF